jgi:aspartate 1-decarboxylase
MNITLLKSKIHRAVVTQADLNYVGSITIDAKLLREAGIMEYEKVEIADIDNGSRLETYAIAGEEGSGIICLNGAAARLVSPGDKIIIMAYAQLTPEECANHHPKVLFVNEQNQLVRKACYEKHGLLKDM